MSDARVRRLAGRYVVIANISEGISRVVLAIKITTMVEVIHCANVLWEEKVERPVKRHTNLFVQAGQLAEVNCPPNPPCEEAREIEAKNPCHTSSTTDRGQQSDGLERE